MKRKVCKVNLNSSDTSVRNNQKRIIGDRSPRKKGKQSDSLNAEAILISSLSAKNIKSNHGIERLKNCFYDVSCIELARGMLGKILVRRLNDGTILKGRIVETECYLGGEDKASHSYSGRITERSKPMYMKPGTTYVYLTYGMYHCFNISSKGPGAAVLLRALEPLEGLEYMKQERQKQKKSVNTKAKDLKSQELCNGPAKLCISFNITKEICNERDLTVWDGMWIEDDETAQDSLNPCQIVTSHRIGIDSVGIEWASKPLRFYILGNTSVSKRDKTKEREVLEMSKYFS